MELKRCTEEAGGRPFRVHESFGSCVISVKGGYA
jgi:hypothetical protein